MKNQTKIKSDIQCNSQHQTHDVGQLWTVKLTDLENYVSFSFS